MSAMNWTTEFPTKPGFYWVRNLRTDINYERTYDPTFQGDEGFIPGPMIIEWGQGKYTGMGLSMIRIGDDVNLYRDQIVSCEWYGPLEPPENEYDMKPRVWKTM